MNEVQIQAGRAVLSGNLIIPQNAAALVLFAHGSGSSRHSPRNRFVARALNDAGLGTLLIDLLSASEEAADRYSAHLRFNIGLLADRLTTTVDWLAGQGRTRGLPIGCLGAS